MNETEGGRSRPEDGPRGPTEGLTLDYPTLDLVTYVRGLEAERAALLATRDRYEAALREIAGRGCPLYYEGCAVHGASNLCESCLAREALAAAPEDTNG
jgi:hypothetical protein